MVHQERKIGKTVTQSLLLAMTVLLSLTLGASSAMASGWSALASTCTPDDNTMLTPERKVAIKYDFRGGAFTFQPASLSAKNWRGLPLPITARCMVLNPYETITPAWGSLIVSYRDPDGPGTASRVVVKLVRTFRPSGMQVIAVFDSNMHPATGATPVDRVVTFDSSDMDFSNSDYAIGMNLYRTTLTDNPNIVRVRLDE